MKFSKHFLKQTAKDYDLSYAIVKNIAESCTTSGEFYQRLENEIDPDIY